MKDDCRARCLVGGVVLALLLFGAGSVPAEGAFMLINETQLGYVQPLDPDADAPVDLRVSVAADGRFVFHDPGDFIIPPPRPPDAPSPCETVRRADETLDVTRVSCDVTGFEVLVIATGAFDDRVAVDAALQTVICGGPGNDTLSGGAGPDLISGAAGNDTLFGGGGKDRLRGDRAPITAGFGAAHCTRTDTGADGDNSLDGGADDDVLAGDGGADVLRGAAGDDNIFGRPGADTLDGGDGRDVLVGMDGDDVLDGGGDLDVLSGGAGQDRMLGGDGNDGLGLPVVLTLDERGPVEESIETGDDVLDGGAGDDTLFGGPGDRTVTFTAGGATAPGRRGETNGADTFSGGPGSDRVSYVNREIPVAASLNGARDDGSAGEGDDIRPDVERLTGGTRNDALIGGPGADELDGVAGADTLAGGDGADVLRGGDADEAADALSGGAGPDALHGGPGSDGLSGGAGDDALHGGGGADRLDGGAGIDDVRGEDDGDELAGGPGADILDGGPGADTASYAAVALPVSVSLDDRRNDGQAGEGDWVRLTENVRGGAGPDTLTGSPEANLLEGGAGGDLLDAGGGEDRLRAGDGADVVLARDDVRDAIACGPGADVALIDARDVPARGVERCERADTGTRARRREALLRPAGCLLRVGFPGTPRDVPVRSPVSIPARTVVDARRCAADLTTVRRGPRLRASRGRFVMRASGGRRRPPRLALAGGAFSACRAEPPSSRVRRLVVRAVGAATVAARRSTATGRNATWTVVDRCASTVTRVHRGRVAVRERGRRAVVVRAGRSHVARSRGRGPR